MTRLVLFLSSVAMIVVILSLRFFHDVKVDNKLFNYDEAKNAHIQITEGMAKNTEHKEGPEEVPEEKIEAVKEIVIVLDTPELVKGAAIYKACISCHGKNAEGKKGQKAPKLAGQYDWYIEKQISDMKNGARINTVMDPYIKKLSPEEIKDVAQYIAKFSW